MADEITVNLSLRVRNGYLISENSTGNSLVSMSGSNASGGAQNIGTTAETINVGDVSTAGYSFFRNLGPTNFVEIGTGTGGSFVSFAKLKVGESAVVRLGTNAPTARANVAAVNLQYMILSD